eukprot:g4736.t1
MLETFFGARGDAVATDPSVPEASSTDHSEQHSSSLWDKVAAAASLAKAAASDRHPAIVVGESVLFLFALTYFLEALGFFSEKPLMRWLAKVCPRRLAEERRHGGARGWGGEMGGSGFGTSTFSPGEEDDDIPPLHMSVPDYKVEEETGFYLVTLARGTGDPLYSVWKRYSEFRELHEQLGAKFPDFPAKKIFNSTRKATLDERRRQLERFLHSVDFATHLSELNPWFGFYGEYCLTPEDADSWVLEKAQGDTQIFSQKTDSGVRRSQRLASWSDDSSLFGPITVAETISARQGPIKSRQIVTAAVTRRTDEDANAIPDEWTPISGSGAQSNAPLGSSSSGGAAGGAGASQTAATPSGTIGGGNGNGNGKKTIEEFAAGFPDCPWKTERNDLVTIDDGEFYNLWKENGDGSTQFEALSLINLQIFPAFVVEQATSGALFASYSCLPGVCEEQ